MALKGAVVDRTRVDVDDARNLRGADLKGPILIEAGGYTAGGAVTLTPTEWRSLEAAWRPELADGPDGPSFPCARARSPAERRICAPETYGRLAELDRELADLHEQAVAVGASTTAEQRRWLSAREACADDECLATRYGERIGVLRGRLARFAVPRPGAEAVYASEHLPVTPEFRRSAIYGRLAPAVMAGLGNTLYVRGLEGGQIEARGEGWFFNAHTCSLYGGPFRFDARTGWHLGRRDRSSIEPGEPTRQPVLRLWGDKAEVNTEANEFADCGMRGSWGGAMVRLPARPEVLARARASLMEEP